MAYDAFISYSTEKDKSLAKELQTVLQVLAKPWYRRRALRVFRDNSSLSATAGLWPTIERALDKSRFVVLLASREAATSKWVAKEIGWWLKHRTVETLLIASTDGELVWDSSENDFVWSDTTPLPSVLRGAYPHEPLWIDLRRYRMTSPKRAKNEFRDAVATLAATIHGRAKEDILSEELLQQRRAFRLILCAATMMSGLILTSFWLKHRADEERIQAAKEFSLRLVELADEEYEFQFVTPLLIALEALPDDTASKTREYVPDAERLLYKTIHNTIGVRSLNAHRNSIEKIEFSPSGTLLLTAGREGNVRLWDAKSGEQISVLEQAWPGVRTATFSPNGNFVAVGTVDGDIRIVSVASGEDILDFSANDDSEAVKALSFSPDGKLLASVGGSTRAKV